jgi:ribosome-binding protein aMBF1 (putative translation factor)
MMYPNLGYLSIESILLDMRRSGETQKRRVRELLRDLREAAGLRQVDLAARLNRPQSFVSKYESGEKTLDFLEVREVCKALGVRLADFVRRYEGDGDEGRP